MLIRCKNIIFVYKIGYIYIFLLPPHHISKAKFALPQAYTKNYPFNLPNTKISL